VTVQQLGVLTLCLIGVVMSGVGVAYAKYASRKHFVELQGLREERDRLEVDWSRLQLEQGTLATHWRIEAEARTRLGMRTPTPQDIKVIRP